MYVIMNNKYLDIDENEYLIYNPVVPELIELKHKGDN